MKLSLTNRDSVIGWCPFSPQTPGVPICVDDNRILTSAVIARRSSPNPRV